MQDFRVAVRPFGYAIGCVAWVPLAAALVSGSRKSVTNTSSMAGDSYEIVARVTRSVRVAEDRVGYGPRAIGAWHGCRDRAAAL